MPTPREDESRDSFLERCIPMLIEEGRKQDQAVAICNSMYEEKAKRPGSPNPSDYLVVEDREKPSTWHLPVKESGKPNHRLMGAAWAALHSGSRGNKYEGPGKSEAIAKLRRLYESEGLPLPSESKSSFTLYKTADGTWRWIAIFTNKYRDNDNPPEILSEASHLDYVKAVESGEWPLPELWLWHIPGTKWGVTELVAYDTAGGFSLAAGTVDKGKEQVAEALNSLPAHEVGVSHGFPYAETQRDHDDSTIITRYRSKEISPLSMRAAANKLTSFSGVETMKLQPKEAEEKLQGWFGKEVWDKISGLVDLKTKEAEDAGLEFKEAEEVPAEVEEEAPAEEEDAEETKAEEAPDEPSEPEAEEKSESYSEEVKEAVLFLADQMRSQQEIIKSMADRIVELESNLAQLSKSDAEKVAEKAAWTTRATAPSLREMLENRVIGKEETRVDGRTKEAKDGPQEFEPQTRYSDNPIMNQAISGITKTWEKDMVLGRGLAPRND